MRKRLAIGGFVLAAAIAAIWWQTRMASSWEVPAGGGPSAGFTNTGLGTDGTNLLIGDFDNERIVIASTEGVYIGEIELAGAADGSVQGVAYDTSDGSYWVCHYDLTAGTIKRYNAAGALQQTITPGVGTPGPNGCAYDATNDRILTAWPDGVIRGYDCADGSLDETITPSGTADVLLDGIALDPLEPTTRLWITIDDNLLYKINRATGAAVSGERVPTNVESIVWLHDVLYLCCDQEFHSAVTDGNRVFKISGYFPETTGLEAYWKLDDLTDSWGSNTLTNNNTATFAAGKIGNGVDVELDSTQFLSIADNASLSFGDEACTICAWVKLETKATSGAVFSKYKSGDQEFEIAYRSSTDAFTILTSSDGTANTATDFQATPSTGAWYFLVFQHDPVGNTISGRPNGGTATSAAWTTGLRDDVSAFCLGNRDGGGAQLDGMIDEVSVWRRLLAFEEINALYNHGAGMTLPARLKSSLMLAGVGA